MWLIWWLFEQKKDKEEVEVEDTSMENGDYDENMNVAPPHSEEKKKKKRKRKQVVDLRFEAEALEQSGGRLKRKERKKKYVFCYPFSKCWIWATWHVNEISSIIVTILCSFIWMFVNWIVCKCEKVAVLLGYCIFALIRLSKLSVFYGLVTSFWCSGTWKQRKTRAKKARKKIM